MHADLDTLSPSFIAQPMTFCQRNAGMPAGVPATPRSSRWPWLKSSWASLPIAGSCGLLAGSSGTCSAVFPPRTPITSAGPVLRKPSNGSSGSFAPRAREPVMISCCLTPRRLNALVRWRRSDARLWRMSAVTDTPAVTPAGSGAAGCICCAPPTVPPERSSSHRPTGLSGKWLLDCCPEPFTVGRPSSVTRGTRGKTSPGGSRIWVAPSLERPPSGQLLGYRTHPIRQRIESVFWTCKDLLNLERHGARTPHNLVVRILVRLLALATCICLNHELGRPSRAIADYTA
jgi:hypothetical protein